MVMSLNLNHSRRTQLQNGHLRRKVNMNPRIFLSLGPNLPHQNHSSDYAFPTFSVEKNIFFSNVEIPANKLPPKNVVFDYMEKGNFFEIFRCNSIFTAMMSWLSWPPFFKHLIETCKKSQLIITPIFPRRSWATPTATVWSCFSDLTCVPRSSTVVNVLKWNVFSSHYKYLTSHSFWTFLPYQQEKLFLFSPKKTQTKQISSTFSSSNGVKNQELKRFQETNIHPSCSQDFGS